MTFKHTLTGVLFTLVVWAFSKVGSFTYYEAFTTYFLGVITYELFVNKNKIKD